MKDFLKNLLPKRFRKDNTIIPVVRLSGAIMAGGNALRPALNLAGVATVLDKAFSMKKAPAVAILINSPGGSPVQARQIYTRIRQLAAELPLSSIVLETDAPDIPPAWLNRGRNAPAELPAIAQTLADLRGLSLAEVSAATSANALAVLPACA